MMKKDWLEFHVEPVEAEYFDESQPEGKPSHVRAIWHGIDLKTMHNDEIHGAKAVERV
jgi:hypothetical protein